GGPGPTELAWTAPPVGAPQTGSLNGADGPDDALRAAVEQALASGEPAALPGLAVPYPPPGLGGGPPVGELHAAVVLPLRARGRTLGALTLAFGPSGRRHGPADLALAEDLAGRAAMALDNARLHQNIQEGDRRKD